MDGLLGPVFTTVHPSYLLRLREPAQAEDEYRRFVDDLRAAGGAIGKAA